MAVQKQILFYLGEEMYGMNVEHIQSIENYVNVVSVPNAPDCIKGIINLRGEIIPVFSLRNKFGLPEKEVTDVTQLIIADANGVMVAFEVDAVKEIVELEEKEIHEPPKIVQVEETEYMESVAMLDGRLVILVNLSGILTENEKENIKLTAENQA